MKGFLLFLTLGSIAIYTLLVISHDGLQDGKAENAFAVQAADQTQPNPPVVEHLSSWGAYLPSGSLSQKPRAALATSQQPAATPPQPKPSRKIQSENPAQITNLLRQRIKHRPSKATARNKSGLSELR